MRATPCVIVSLFFCFSSNVYLKPGILRLVSAKTVFAFDLSSLVTFIQIFLTYKNRTNFLHEKEIQNRRDE